MPFYYGSKARSVPEYLKLRFDERTRGFNSISFAVMTIMASGISMHELAKLLQTQMSWPESWPMDLHYNASLWISSAVVLVYVFKGGLTSAIYTEVLQFCMIVLGFAPVVYLGMQDIGGWTNLRGALTQVAEHPAAVNTVRDAGSFASNAWTNAWRPLIDGPAANPMGVDVVAMVFGLGFVLAFGYWCTNFLVVQRAMAVRNMTAARRTPLIGAVPKMFLPALVILPGMIAIGLTAVAPGKYRIPQKEVKPEHMAATIAAVEDAAKDKETSAALAEYVKGTDAAGKMVDEPGTAGEVALKKIGKAADTDFNQYRLAQVVVIQAAHHLPKGALEQNIQKASANDYDQVITSLIHRYCPPGLLGLALTALLASFMSGMAGNVTAFNTVWTYDLYQAYMAPNRSDAALYVDGPRGNRRRHPVEHSCRLRGKGIQQRHGHHPTGVRLRQRAVVCDISTGHVLGADNRQRRLLRSCGWHRHVGARCMGLTDRRRKRRMVGHDALCVQIDNGPELLAGGLRLQRLLHPHRGNLARRPPRKERRRPQGPRLLSHAADRRSHRGLVRQARLPGRAALDRLRGAQLYLLVTL